MGKAISRVLAGLLVATLWVSAEAVLPTADPNASADARAILSYLEALPQRADHRVVSGQFLGHPMDNYAWAYDKYITQLQQQTGQWVAMAGADYERLTSSYDPVDLSKVNAPLIAHWQQGGLVTISWHARNPWTWGNSRDRKIGKYEDLFRPGTKANKNWMTQLDRMADALGELQSAGVTVLWRPLHEGNGKSFWWTQAKKAQYQVNLWRQVFDYLTVERGLHNLLWVYSAVPVAKSGRAADYAYPGDGYVDIVGVDAYTPELQIDEDYQTLIRFGKPFMLTEFGPVSGSDVENDPSLKDPHYDYARLIQQIRQRYPLAVGFQAWNSYWAMVSQLNAKGLLEDPWVINRDGLD